MAVKMKMTARNAAFQRFETLKRSREKRHRQRLAFVEGVHPFEQAISNGWAFDSVGYPAGKRLSGWAHDMLGKASIDTLYEIEPALMDELSEREESCELIGLVKMREDALGRMARVDTQVAIAFGASVQPLTRMTASVRMVVRISDGYWAIVSRKPEMDMDIGGFPLPSVNRPRVLHISYIYLYYITFFSSATQIYVNLRKCFVKKARIFHQS